MLRKGNVFCDKRKEKKSGKCVRNEETFFAFVEWRVSIVNISRNPSISGQTFFGIKILKFSSFYFVKNRIASRMEWNEIFEGSAKNILVLVASYRIWTHIISYKIVSLFCMNFQHFQFHLIWYVSMCVCCVGRRRDLRSRNEERGQRNVFARLIRISNFPSRS